MRLARALRREVRTRLRAAPTSTPAVARATRAGYRASRRRSDRAPARPAGRGSPSPAARGRRRRAARRPRAREAPTSRARRRAHAPQRPRQPIPPKGASQRTTASALMPDQATGHHRPRRQAGALQPPQTAVRGQPARRESDRAPALHSGRTPRQAPHAAGRVNAPSAQASARTTDANRRTRAPSRTPRPTLARRDTPTLAPSDSPVTPTCRPPPRHATRAHDSDPSAH